MCPLKLWAQWTQKSGTKLGAEISEGGVSIAVANTVRLKGSKVKPSGKKIGQCHHMQFSMALGVYKRHPPPFLWLLVQGPQDLGRGWALGKEEAYPRKVIKGSCRS